MEDPDFHREERKSSSPINLNTGISGAVLLAILSGFSWMSSRFSDIELHRVQDNAAIASKMEAMNTDVANARRETAEARRELTDKASDRWKFGDMWRWSVQLQRSNSDAGIKLVVPEPERDKN